MAQSIKLGSDTYLDGSGLIWVKGILSGDADIDSMRKPQDSGMYYLNNVSTTAAPYGMFLVFGPLQSGGSAYQVQFLAGYIYTRSYSSSTGWSHWYRYTGTDIGS